MCFIFFSDPALAWQETWSFQTRQQISCEGGILQSTAAPSSSDTAKCYQAWPRLFHSPVVSSEFKAGSFGIRLLRNWSLQMCKRAHWVKVRLELVLEPRINVTEEQDRNWGFGEIRAVLSQKQARSMASTLSKTSTPPTGSTGHRTSSGNVRPSIHVFVSYSRSVLS